MAAETAVAQAYAHVAEGCRQALLVEGLPEREALVLKLLLIDAQDTMHAFVEQARRPPARWQAQAYHHTRES